MVSDFKAQIAADTATFLNLDEFADSHEIDGRIITVLVDEEELQTRKSSSSNPTDGIYDAVLLFYAKKADFPERPVIGKPMQFDDRTLKVADVQEDAVMYTITLKGLRS
jgi:hypothetical protein